MCVCYLKYIYIFILIHILKRERDSVCVRADRCARTQCVNICIYIHIYIVRHNWGAPPNLAGY